MTIVYHPTRKHSTRPNNFRRVPDHPFWAQCEYASLQQNGGSLIHFDSSVFQGHGTRQPLASGPYWEWIEGFHCTRHQPGASSGHVILPRVYTMGTGDSISVWYYVAVGTSYADIVGNGQGDNYNWMTVRASGMRFHARGSFPNFNAYAGYQVGQWVHYAVLKPSALTWQLFENGIQVDESTSGFDDFFDFSRLGDSYGDGTSFNGNMRDFIFHHGTQVEDIQRFADPDNVMLSGAIEPVPTETFFIPSPVVSAGLTKIFKSRIIRGAA